MQLDQTTLTVLTGAFASLGQLFASCGHALLAAALAPNAPLSIYSLFTALAIAAAWLVRGRRQTKLSSLRKVLFPARWLSGPSARADWGFTILNLFFTGTMVGWAIMSSNTIAHFVGGYISDQFGPAQVATPLSPMAPFVITLVMYLAYETAYFVDHYLSHHVAFLWHFHRTHHTAETLSPLTNFRVHPVDSIVFYNLVAIFTGIADGVMNHIFCGSGQFTLFGNNAVLIVALYLLTHLHHSHIWMAFTGKLGLIVMSPAHHQIHHSDDPAHHNRNFGNTLALFDWLAGTLLVPTAKRTRLTFGSGEYAVNPHGLTGGLVQPFIDAVASLRRPRSAPDKIVTGELARH